MKELLLVVLMSLSMVCHARCEIECRMETVSRDTVGVVVSHHVSPTDIRPWEALIHELAESEDMETDAWENFYDRLSQLEESPININRADREELGQLPFLSDSQIEDICEYIYRYGGMKTVQELVAISSIDYIRRGLMRHFVYAGEPEKEKVRDDVVRLFKNGHHELTGYVKLPFYDRKGDVNGYHGYKYKHWFRYGYVSGNRLKFGLVASQDAGEPLFGNKNRLGYDYYSPYFLLRGAGRMETLAIGRYRLSFGMGLVVNSGLTMGKASMLAGMGRSSNNITAHSSRMESGYFQGVGATVRISKSLRMSVFVSYRNFDATLNKDENHTAATLITSGYHRTDLELQKKNNTHAMAGGMNTRYYRNGFYIGATSLYTRLSRELRPDKSQAYRQYYASGRDFINTSVDYGYVNGMIAVKGETAVNKSGALATVNTVSADIFDNLSIMLLQRYYSRRYSSLYSRSFSEGGHVQNESGVYLGAGYSPCRNLRITAYSDYAYFPWVRYRVSRSSWASDNMLQGH
ncbi:ComEA family DNA-binding protein [Xylanibacter muris]|uniref:Helix-hairpin-helix domain-containing protein n=1 Tax=Xylanibacter muris TaxID=2736290 RepID=A0ABX2AJN8_9BACT|nr:helix-hairpin-helix domain-containing protein [Xylanibacter muris]NPD90930.1 helix-hairpin-helix domain-containing protein [Xylanibacter muris]